MNFANNVARAFAPLALVAVAAPAPAATSADLGLVRSHISAVQTMSANFTQTDARGRAAAGKLQLKRPGRVRFEYGSGDLLLVANGKTLTYIDYQVGQKSSWPLHRTPLGVLLSGSPDLKGRAQIVPNKDSRLVIVRARDPAQYGSILLVFIRNPSGPGGLQLHGWTAIDAQNKRTTVRLSNVRYNVAVPDSAFSYAEPKKRAR
jgi:outer membrane lipoprotein-sorting protein